MGKVKYNMLMVDYMQLSLMAASHFILNFEDMMQSKDRYIYDLKVLVKGFPLILNVIYDSSTPKADNSFSFEVVSEDADLELIFRGCYNLACSYAADIMAEYIRRVGR